MTSSNGNIFRVTGHLCGKFTGHRWISHTKASDAELWCLLWSAPWVNNREAGDLRRYLVHYDVIVMVHICRWDITWQKELHISFHIMIYDRIKGVIIIRHESFHPSCFQGHICLCRCQSSITHLNISAICFVILCGLLSHKNLKSVWSICFNSWCDGQAGQKVYIPVETPTGI